ncbi:hypothetical protein [Mycolicibacterium sp. XJ1904]
MTVRRNRGGTTLEAVLAALPDRFWDAEVYHEQGSMTGLVAFMDDLGKHLGAELRAPADEDPPTVDAMETLGIPPSEWYRALLTLDQMPKCDGQRRRVMQPSVP